MNWILYYLRPYWLTGPILDKEMRVSSRRRRTYAIRVAWVCLLMMFVALVWGAYISGRRQDSTYGTYSLAEMAMVIVIVVTWFGFIMAQLLGIVFLSTSVSDEIYRRTLGVLMTTSINSVQIVIGKLLGKLLQIILLLAVIVPVLAVIRVFGGVPWEFIIASTAVTLCATIFCSSLSLFFSIFSRRAYWIILQTLITLGLWYFALPLGIGSVLHEVFNLREMDLMPVLGAPNPILAMAMLSEWLERPGRMIMPGLPSMGWIVTIHCGIVLVLSGVLILLSIIFVRRAALRQAMGESGSRRKERRSAWHALATTPPPLPTALPDGSSTPPIPRPVTPAERKADTGIRPVRGWPVMWKEMRAPLFGSRGKIIGAIIFVALLLCSYLLAGNDIDDSDVQAAYVAILTCLGILSTAILAATGITTEREARSWDVLLVTGLGDWQIIVGKAAGAIRKSLVAWGLLGLHLAIFLVLGYLKLHSVIMLVLLAGYLLIFWTGAGIMFSCFVKNTTTAVVLNVVFAVTLYLAVPLVAALGAKAMYGPGPDSDMEDTVYCLNPAVQGVILTNPWRWGNGMGYRSANYAHYEWPDNDAQTPNATTFRMASYTLLFSLFGIAMAAIGSRNMRRIT